MKRPLIISSLLFLALAAASQPLANFNYAHIYNPSSEVNLNLKLVKSGNTLVVVFTALYNNGLFSSKDFRVEFETRKNLSEKEGTPITSAIDTLLTSEKAFSGRVTFTASEDLIFVARIVKIPGNEKFYFWRYIPNDDTPYLISQGILASNFVNVESTLKVGGFRSDVIIASYYKRNFPAAAPPFSTKQAPVSSVIMPDSIFNLQNASEFNLAMKGLYLIQADTSSNTGLSVRAEVDYPKLAKISSLIGPLVYVCTRQEFEKLANSNGDKKKFDHVILNIVGDAERASSFMRNYFYRVELANLFFTSYKEGWKTDRGMIFVIYGLPSAVYLFGNREVWEYSTSDSNKKESFIFQRSSTVFDPDNFILIRDKRYEDTWYRSIDLWRKSRY